MKIIEKDETRRTERSEKLIDASVNALLDSVGKEPLWTFERDLIQSLRAGRAIENRIQIKQQLAQAEQAARPILSNYNPNNHLIAGPEEE